MNQNTLIQVIWRIMMKTEDLIVLCEEIIDQLEGNKDLDIVLNNAHEIRASLVTYQEEE